MSALAAKLLFGGMAVLFFGLLLVAHGCTVVMGGGGHVFGAERTDGRIVEIRKRPSNNPGRRRGLVHEATVEFNAAGRTIKLDDNTGLTGATRSVGETVPVSFDAREPEKALIGGTAPFTVTPYLFELIAGWLIVAVAGVAMARGKALAAAEPKARRK